MRKDSVRQLRQGDVMGKIDVPLIPFVFFPDIKKLGFAGNDFFEYFLDFHCVLLKDVRREFGQSGALAVDQVDVSRQVVFPEFFDHVG